VKGHFNKSQAASQTQTAQEVGMERLLTQKDEKNQPIFLTTAGKIITFQ